MPNMDLHNNVKFSRGISPVAAVTNDDPFVSQICDFANSEQNEFIGQLGALADANVTLTVLFEHGDDSGLSDAAAAPDDDLLGVEAMSLTFANDDDTFKIGYRGRKRYGRVTITPANNTGNIFLAGIWAQSGTRKGPQSTQVVAG